MAWFSVDAAEAKEISMPTSMSILAAVLEETLYTMRLGHKGRLYQVQEFGGQASSRGIPFLSLYLTVPRLSDVVDSNHE